MTANQDFGKEEEKMNFIRKRVSAAENIFYVCNYLFLTLCVIVAVFPIVHVIASSFSSSNAIISGKVFLLPVETTLDSYRDIFKDGNVLKSMNNTVIITVIGTALNMIFTIMCAYPISRKRLQGRGFFSGLFVFTMIFGGGLIPNFLLVKSLKIVDTYWALWLPSLISVYNMIILKTSFQNIPDSLEEAAMIDGANDIYILVRIMLPLLGSVLATLSLFSAVGWWNEYYNSMIFLNSTAKLPMTVRLMQMIESANRSSLMNGEGISANEFVTPEGIKAATIVVTMVPILCVYPFLQKYFVKGVMIGSVKG